MSDWCILRTGSNSAVRLVEALAEAGITAWTPTDTRVRRVGSARDREEYQVPIMPGGFVFADYDRLRELIAMSRSPALTYQTWDAKRRCMVTRGYPYFTVFGPQGVYPKIADQSLEPLRRVEARLLVAYARMREAERQSGEPPKYAAGEIVRVDDGPYGGLDLVVMQSNSGKLVKVTCAGWTQELEILAWHLKAVQLKVELH